MRHPRRDRLVEEIAACVERSFGGEGVTVQRGTRVLDVDSGQPREVDVLVEGSLGSARVRVIVECRDRSDTADVTWIEQLATKRRSVDADYVIAVSTSGFTEPAVAKANKERIELRQLVELSEEALKSKPSLVHISLRRVEHRIHPEVKLFLAPFGHEQPISILETRVDQVSVEPATGPGMQKSLHDFLEAELRVNLDETILSAEPAVSRQEEPLGTVAENEPFDFATPDPRQFVARIDDNAFQFVRVCGHRTSFLKNKISLDIGGYEFLHVNKVESGLLGEIIVIGAPLPDGRIWPFIFHRIPATGKQVLYVCGQDLFFNTT